MTRKILIVEDNELNLKLFRDLLEAHSFQTVQTRDGNAVVAMVSAERPDLILMDIQLPEISGLELIQQLKRNSKLKKIPIIAVTAYAMREDEEKIMASGCESYIAKPIAIDNFIETINKFVNQV